MDTPRPMTMAKNSVLSSANVRGMLWMLGAAASLTLVSAVTKELGRTLPISEMVFFRMGFGIFFLVPWMGKVGLAGVATNRLGLHLARALSGLLGLVLYVYAVNNMLLANATALGFSTPLWMIVVSFWWLRERVGIRRGGATVLGFVGVLIIARPDLAIDPAAGAALGSAFIICIAMILVKRLSTTEPAVRIVFYLSVFGVLFSAIPTVFQWVTPSAWELAMLFSTGLGGSVGLYCQARAYGVGDPTVVAPVDFTRLVLACVLGSLFFGELPDMWAFVGMSVILLSVFYISRRESLRSRAPNR